MKQYSRRGVLGFGATAATATLAAQFTLSAPAFRATDSRAGDWPSRRGGSRRTASSPRTSPPFERPTTHWRLTDRSDAIAVADDVAFIGSDDTVAVDVEDGAHQWRVDRSLTNLAVHDDVVIGSRTDGMILALDRADGSLKWSTEPGSLASISDVVVTPNRTYVSGDGRILALDTGTGDSAWTVQVSDAGAVRPAIADGALVAGAAGPLEVFGPRRGVNSLAHAEPRTKHHEFWEAVSVGYPALGDDLCVVGSRVPQGDGQSLRAFDRGGFSLAWEFDAGSRASPPALTADIAVSRVAGGSSDGGSQLLALRDGSSEVAWDRQLESTGPPPVIAGSLVLAGGTDGSLVAVDVSSGDVTWRSSFSSAVRRVIPAGDALLVLSADGVLRGMR